MTLTTLSVDPGTYPSAGIAVDNAGAGGYVQVMKLAVSAAGVTTLIPADSNGIWMQGAGAAGAPAGGVLSVQGVTAGKPLSVQVLDAVASGNLTATAQVVQLLSLNGASTVTVVVSGTWAGTLNFEGSLDGVTFYPLNASAVPNGALATTTTANGVWQVDVSGFVAFQVRCSAYTSGTAVVAMRGSEATGALALDAPLPTGANAIGSLAAGSATIGGVYGVPSTSSTYALTPYFPTSGNIVAAAIKASAGNLYGMMAVNQVAAVTWLCFYNKATAPVLGTDTPVWAVPIPAGAATGIITMPPGLFALANFATGIAIAAATTPAGAAAPATAPTGMCFYK